MHPRLPPAVAARDGLIGPFFAGLWALVPVVHLLNQTHGHLHLESWPTLAAAVWLLLRPGSAHRLALLAVAQLSETVIQMPMVASHQCLTAVVNLVILLSYLRRRGPATTSEVMADAAVGARVVLLVSYSAAALAKYNTDFLSTSTSCADYMAGIMSFGLVDRQQAIAPLFIYATLASESVIPVLLLVPRLRRYGVLFGTAFHFTVSLSPVMAVGDFSMTLWALFFLFLPQKDAVAVIRQWSRLGSRLRPRVPRRGTLRQPLVLAACLGLVPAAAVSPFFVQVVVWLFTTGFGALQLRNLAELLRVRDSVAEPLGRPSHPQRLIVLALVLWLTAPWVGLGTSTRFAMFSGLRTEAQPNHLFIPTSHVFANQSEALVVMSVTDAPGLIPAADAHAAVPEVEIRRSMADPKAGGSFRTLGGEPVEVVPGEPSSLRAQPSWLLRKFNHFRPFKVPGTTDPNFCTN